MNTLNISQDTYGDNPSGSFIVSINGNPIASFDFKLEAENFTKELKQTFNQLLDSNNGTQLN